MNLRRHDLEDDALDGLMALTATDLSIANQGEFFSALHSAVTEEESSVQCCTHYRREQFDGGVRGGGVR